MNKEHLLDRISRGRTDLVFDLLRLPDWRGVLHEGQVKPLQWFVYYNDVTALKAVFEAGGDLGSLDLNDALGNAAFFGHWKVCDFLIGHGADREARDVNGDSPLSWASEHLRPGEILALLAFGPHRIGENSRKSITSDHGAGWGNGMEWKFLGDYLPESAPGEQTR